MAVTLAVAASVFSCTAPAPPIPLPVVPLAARSFVGLDPYDSGCAADARTEARASVTASNGRPIAIVDLRYSPRCEMAWARAVRIHGTPGMLVAVVRVGGAESAFEHATDGEVWTDMVAAPHACATAAGGIRSVEGVLRGTRAEVPCEGDGALGLVTR